MGCNWSWLRDCAPPDGLCHLLVQEDQKKEENIAKDEEWPPATDA